MIINGKSQQTNNYIFVIIFNNKILAFLFWNIFAKLKIQSNNMNRETFTYILKY